MILIILVAILNLNFKISNKYFINIIKYSVTKISGLEINFEKINIKDLSNLELENLELKNNSKEILLKSRLATIKLNLFDKRKLDKLVLDDVEAFVKLDKNNIVNWQEESNKEFVIPNIGNIIINSGKIYYNDYKHNIFKSLDIKNSLIEFEKEKIIISLLTPDGSLKLDLSEKKKLINIKFQNIEAENQFLNFIPLNNALKILKGKADLDLKINIEPLGVEGFINFKGDISVIEISPVIEIEANLVLNSNLIKGEFKSNASGISIKNDLNIDLINKRIDLEFSSPKEIEGNNLIKLFKFVDIYKLKPSGKFILNNTKLISNFKDLRLISKIKGENSKLFNNCFIEADLDINLTKLYLSQIYIKFDNLILKSRLNGEILDLESFGNISFISKYYDLNILDGNFTLNGNIFKKLDNLNMHIFLENIKNTNLNNLNGKLEIKDKTFNLNFENDMLSISSKIYNKELYINFKSLDLKLMNTKILGEGYFKLNETLDILDSNLNLVLINKIDPIELKAICKNNLFDVEISSLKILSKNFQIKTEPIFFRASIDIKNDIYKVIGNIKSLNFNFNKIENSFENIPLNLIISNKKLLLEKFVSKKISLSGFWNFLNKDESYIRFELKNVNLPYLAKISRIIFNINFFQDNINLDLKGKLSYFNISIPVEGSFTYKDNILDIRHMSIESSDVKGKIDFLKDDIEIIFRAIDTKIFKTKSFSFNYLGNIYIYGNLKDFKVYSDFNFKNVKYKNNNITDLQGTFTIRKGILCFGDILVYNEYINFFLKPNGIIDFFNNYIDLDIFNQSIEVKNSNLEGYCSLDISLKGDLTNPLYKVIFETNNFKYNKSKIDNLIFNITGNNLKADVTDSYLIVGKDKLEFQASLDIKNKKYTSHLKAIDIKLDLFESLFNLDKCRGYVTFDLNCSSEDITGFLKINKGIIKTDLIKFNIPMSIPLEFYNINLDTDLIGNHIKINLLTAKLNEGIFECIGNAFLKNLSLDSYSLNIKLQNVNFDIDKNIQLKLNSDLKILDRSIKGKVIINSGRINGIKTYAKSNSKNDINVDLKININPIEISFTNILNLESLNSYIEGNLELTYKNELKIAGVIKANRGNITFQQNYFKILDARISFDKAKLSPYLELNSSSRILNENINLSLNGYLDSKDIQILDKITYTSNIEEKDDKIFRIYLWTDSSLSLDNILYLLSGLNSSKKSDFSFQSSRFISEQVAKALVLNPLSRGIKDLLGIYHLKINTELFNTDSSDNKLIKNPLIEVEAITNLYKNIIFLRFACKALISANKNNIDYLSIGMLNKNQFAFNILFNKIILNETKSNISLGISKKFNFKNQNVYVGFSGLSFNNYKNLKLDIETNIKF